MPAWGDVLCDVKHCTDPCFVKVDGVAYCELHFEIMWDRWNVPADSRVREVFDDVSLRFSVREEAALAEQTWRELG